MQAVERGHPARTRLSRQGGGGGLERQAEAAYSHSMDDTPHPLDAPPAWAEALDESLAELAAGIPTVPSEAVRRDLLDSIARMEAKRAAAPKRKTTSRR